METFLAVFTGTPAASARSGWDALSESVRKQRTEAGIKAWHAWMEQHSARIVQHGGPVGKTKRIDAAGIADASNNLCGFVVVRAASHDEAAKLFIDHPHFAIFPGDAVEVMPCLPTPGL